MMATLRRSVRVCMPPLSPGCVAAAVAGSIEGTGLVTYALCRFCRAVPHVRRLLSFGVNPIREGSSMAKSNSGIRRLTLATVLLMLVAGCGLLGRHDTTAGAPTATQTTGPTLEPPRAADAITD